MGIFKHIEITTLIVIFYFCNIYCQVCETGKYGPYCRLPCSEYCIDLRCDPVNGSCYNCRDRRSPPLCRNFNPAPEPKEVYSYPFGFFDSKKQYLCHCSKGCDSTGNCTGTSTECDKDWFGLACQYQNLADAFISNIKPEEAKSLLTAPVNGECKTNESISSIEINWSMPLPFTWMRFKVKNTEMLYRLNVSFMNENMSKSPCVNQTLLQVDTNTFDFRCGLITAMKKMLIEGDTLKSICYIRINGGRNIALKQNATQSSTYQGHEATLAVDGSVKTSCKYVDCTRTILWDPNPQWMLTFDQPYIIQRFIIYNRFDHYIDLLKKFTLKTYDKEGHIVFNYQDENNIGQQVYTVLYPKVDPVYKVSINQRNKYFFDYTALLVINEFEAYGECPDGAWGLGCNKTCNSSCNYSCNKDDGTCNAVCIPNTNPIRCLTDCDTGKYGSYCQLNCSEYCIGQRCDSVNGHCHSCPVGHYLPFCAICSNQCFESHTCDPFNGTCYNGCKDGYTGLKCLDICPLGSYGPHCSKNCSVHCSESYKCDPVYGSCNNGCKDGYTEPLCLSKMQLTDPHFSVSTLISGSVITCSLVVLVAVIVWYLWRKKSKRQKQFEIEIKYQKDGLISDSST